MTGDFAVNTSKFTVAASSGNTAVAGTLGVTGAATLSSTLAVTGASTLTGALAVNDTTASTSTTTGSGKFAGGIGVAKASVFGGAITVVSANSAGVANDKLLLQASSNFAANADGVSIAFAVGSTNVSRIVSAVNAAADGYELQLWDYSGCLVKVATFRKDQTFVLSG